MAKDLYGSRKNSVIAVGIARSYRKILLFTPQSRETLFAMSKSGLEISLWSALEQTSYNKNERSTVSLFDILMYNPAFSNKYLQYKILINVIWSHDKTFLHFSVSTKLTTFDLHKLILLKPGPNKRCKPKHIGISKACHCCVLWEHVGGGVA